MSRDPSWDRRDGGQSVCARAGPRGAAPGSWGGAELVGRGTKGGGGCFFRRVRNFERPTVRIPTEPFYERNSEFSAKWGNFYRCTAIDAPMSGCPDTLAVNSTIFLQSPVLTER